MSCRNWTDQAIIDKLLEDNWMLAGVNDEPLMTEAAVRIEKLKREVLHLNNLLSAVEGTDDRQKLVPV